MTTQKAVRKIIAKALEIDFRRIRVDGELLPEFVPKNHADVSMGLHDNEVHEVYGYKAETGLKRLSINRDYFYRTDSGGSQEYGESIHQYFERTGEYYEYILVHHYGSANMQQWDGYGLYMVPASMASARHNHFVCIDKVNVSDNDINDEIIHVLCKCPQNISGAKPIVTYHEFDYIAEYNHNREYPKWFTSPDWSECKTDYSGRSHPINYSFEEFLRQCQRRELASES